MTVGQLVLRLAAPFSSNYLDSSPSGAHLLRDKVFTASGKIKFQFDVEFASQKCMAFQRAFTAYRHGLDRSDCSEFAFPPREAQPEELLSVEICPPQHILKKFVVTSAQKVAKVAFDFLIGKKHQPFGYSQGSRQKLTLNNYLAGSFYQIDELRTPARERLLHELEPEIGNQRLKVILASALIFADAPLILTCFELLIHHRSSLTIEQMMQSQINSSKEVDDLLDIAQRCVQLQLSDIAHSIALKISVKQQKGEQKLEELMKSVQEQQAQQQQKRSALQSQEASLAAEAAEAEKLKQETLALLGPAHAKVLNCQLEVNKVTNDSNEATQQLSALDSAIATCQTAHTSAQDALTEYNNAVANAQVTADAQQLEQLTQAVTNAQQQLAAAQQAREGQLVALTTRINSSQLLDAAKAAVVTVQQEQESVKQLVSQRESEQQLVVTKLAAAHEAVEAALANEKQTQEMMACQLALQLATLNRVVQTLNTQVALAADPAYSLAEFKTKAKWEMATQMPLQLQLHPDSQALALQCLQQPDTADAAWVALQRDMLRRFAITPIPATPSS